MIPAVAPSEAITTAGRRKYEIARRVIIVGLSIDKQADRLTSELFYDVQYQQRVRRIGATIDQDDSFPGDDDTAVGGGVSPGNIISPVDIDAISDF